MMKRTRLNRISAAVDFLLVFFSYLVSAWFRLKVLNGWWKNRGLSRLMIIASVFYAAGLLLMLSILGFYETTRIKKLTWKLRTLFMATTFSIFIVTAFIFAFKIEDVSRGIIAIFYFLTLSLLGGKQVLARIVMSEIRKNGYDIKHQLVVGTGKLARQYLEDIGNEPELGIGIEGTVGADADLGKELAEKDIDEVVIALEPEEYTDITRLIAACEEHGVRYCLIPFYNLPVHSMPEVIGRSKLINMRADRLGSIGWAGIKRGFDVAISAMCLFLTCPLMGMIATGVKLSSPGPIFIKQKRMGYRNKPFYMLKFRTDGGRNGLKFGNLIRKTGLDGLPQLMNVLKGDMSLVGPKPDPPCSEEEHRAHHLIRQHVRPGMTGWAQVNGCREGIDENKHLQHDLWYIDNWSILLDLRILFMAFPWVLADDGKRELDEGRDVKVILCTHKPYWMPQDGLYMPLHVGAALRGHIEGLAQDNTGENISSKNASYCELTGLYWAWKNLDCEYLGLAHYRRYFTVHRGTSDRRDVLSLDQARRLLRDVDVVLPKKRYYWIETNYDQYVHAHHREDLEETRKIIKEKCPEYLKAYDRCMHRRSGHRFNMFIMKKGICDGYCSWLFDILFELEGRLDTSHYTANDQRVFGFVAERLLDVWLEANQIKHHDIPYIFLEKENWITKGVRFVIRKLESGKAG